MGYVGTFCQVSASSPVAGQDLPYYVEGLLESHEKGPKAKLMRQAAEELGKEHAARAELTVIGPINKDGRAKYPEESDFSDKADAIIASDAVGLRVVSHCESGSSFEFGYVTTVDSGEDYLISYGPCLYTMSAALPVLFVATQGRLTLQRIWLLSASDRIENDTGYVLEGVDYGEIENCIDQFLRPLPKFTKATEEQTADAVRAWLEKGKTAEDFKEILALDGGFWVWLNPDHFPLKASPSPLPLPSLLDVPPSSSSANPPRPSLSTLPHDLLVHLSSLLPLSSVLSLTATSRTLRHTLLSTLQKRSLFAHAWLRSAGRYWLPLDVDIGLDLGSSKPVEEKDVRLGKVELRKLEEGDDWWMYLRRCAGSGSMQNRKRIWQAALSVEEVVEKAGL